MKSLYREVLPLARLSEYSANYILYVTSFELACSEMVPSLAQTAGEGESICVSYQEVKSGILLDHVRIEDATLGKRLSKSKVIESLSCSSSYVPLPVL